MLAIADDEGLRLLEFVDRRALERELTILRSRLNTNVVPGEHPYLEAVRTELARYFAGSDLEFSVPLAPVGSPFQLRTWELLRTIPTGETRSYSWMAKQLGDAEMRRAVGRANGDNMMCIIIPCHRVIRADGTLCGYGGGLWRKKWLLEHERKFVSRGSEKRESRIENRES
jgi:AraC family transcriptional regulator of adaptative response/methylated-DNA-[protein]-cysteine methyltransferase